MAAKKKKPSRKIRADSLTDFDIYRFNCGSLDVHSDLIVATVGITDKETFKTEYTQKSFGTFSEDLKDLSEWFLSFDCKDVAMESTGKYMIPVCNVLEDNGITYTVTHPKYVKSPDGHKDDYQDSLHICQLHKYNLVRASFIPPRQIRECRDLGRRYFKLTNELTAEKNRYQNCMTSCNITLDQVFSDPFGKSATAVMNEIVNSDEINEEVILSLVDPRCKKKDKVLDAIRGMNLKPDQQFKMKDISAHMSELNTHRQKVLAEIITRLSPDYDKFSKSTTITGVSVLSSFLIVSEIGYDMSVWKNENQLTFWAGLTPGANISNGKKKSTRITKAGHYLKPLLVQCALAAIKSTKNPYFKIKYTRLRKRRGHKKAIIAIARMILCSFYHVLKNDKEFHPSDYDQVVNPQPKQKKSSDISAQDAIEALRAKGFDVSALLTQLPTADTATTTG